jgi:transglutaminase-like putative cysteine protease
VQPETSLTPAWEALHKGGDYGQCRTAVQLLNDYLNRSPEDRPPALSDAERALLTSRFQLSPDELAEVESPTFTLLDAHHLEDCLLLRDAADALRVQDLPPLERANAAFAWVVRQVRLYEKPGAVLPPVSALRRGGGSPQERALIFLEILRQLGLEGCMAAVPGADASQAVRYWLPGVVIDKDIYLYETRMGLPLPGPKDAGNASLAQVRSQPDILQSLSADEKHRYEVTADQAKQAEAHFACPLSGLTPRMRWLQEKMASEQKVQLAVVPAARLEALETAAKGGGAPVKVWNTPGDPNTPVRIIRSTVPPEEGGTDKAHRREQWLLELVPWAFMSPTVRDMPGDPGRRLKEFFARPFLSLAMEPNWPRDMALRGRYRDATSMLVRLRDVFQQLRSDKQTGGDVDAKLAKWRDRAVSAYANLLRAQQGGPAGNPAGLGTAQAEVNALWKESDKLVMWLQAAAAEPLIADTTYQLALCQQEQAERAQGTVERTRRTGKAPSESERTAAQDAWRSAADWWATYLDDYPNSPAAGDARVLRAQALAAVGDMATAEGLLKEQAAKATGLDKVACQYRLKRLQGR